MDLSKSNIIITGAGGAFGSFLLESLTGVSACVIGLDLHFDNLSSELKRAENVLLKVVDLTNEEEVATAVSEIIEECGAIHGLVNNAGIIHSEPLVNLFSKESPLHSLASWKKIIDINLTAVFTLSSHVALAMMKNRTKGAIINISSISAYGNAGQSAYAASKAGVIGLTKTWAKELAIWGIRSNAIAPGFFDTPSTHDALNDSIVKHIKKETPLKKLGKPEELFHSLKYALENEFLNGDVIDLTGGLTL